MSRGINKVIVLGTCGKDAEVRYAQSGSAITTISVATNEKWKDKNGEQQERTEWHRVKFFGRLAEISGEYLKKGQLVYIEGSLRTEKYTDKDGIDRYSTDIIASEMQMLGGAPNGEGRQDRGVERGSSQQGNRGGQGSGNRSGGGSAGGQRAGNSNSGSGSGRGGYGGQDRGEPAMAGAGGGGGYGQQQGGRNEFDDDIPF